MILIHPLHVCCSNVAKGIRALQTEKKTFTTSAFLITIRRFVDQAQTKRFVSAVERGFVQIGNTLYAACAADRRHMTQASRGRRVRAVAMVHREIKKRMLDSAS
jgi:hypothetical protein